MLLKFAIITGENAFEQYIRDKSDLINEKQYTPEHNMHQGNFSVQNIVRPLFFAS